MNSYNINFKINDREKIVIQLEEPLEYVGFIYFVPIVFLQDDRVYLLSDGEGRTLYSYMQDFEILLQMALDNKLRLHESLRPSDSSVKDIGYFFNESRQDKPVVHAIEADGREGYWVGMNYMFAGQDCVAWVYNDDNSDIIFKLTPRFPGNSLAWYLDETDSPEALENSKWYDEWIKTYKPILERKIPRDIAQQWLAKAQEIIATIQKNDRMWKAESNSCKKLRKR